MEKSTLPWAYQPFNGLVQLLSMYTKPTEIELSNFLKEGLERAFRYFCNQTGASPEEAQDLASECTLETLVWIRHRGVQSENWPKGLSVIMERRKVDYFRQRSTRKEQPLEVNDEGEPFEISDSAQSADQFFETEDIQSGSFINNLSLARVVCGSRHRSLQEVVLIAQSETAFRLGVKIRQEFPLVARRFLNNGLNFKAITKDEKLTEQQLNKMYVSFGQRISEISKNLGIKDPIGVQALEALLLAPNPWPYWYSLSKKRLGKIQGYLTRNPTGKLHREKPQKRPYLYLFRDLLSYHVSLLGIKKFIQYEANEKMPDYPVSQQYVIDRYNLGGLSSQALARQKAGRKNTPGLKEKILDYSHQLDSF